MPVALARRLCHALVAAGAPAVYVEFPRAEHAFDLLFPPLLGTAGQAALYDLERFLACVVTQTPMEAQQEARAAHIYFVRETTSCAR